MGKRTDPKPHFHHYNTWGLLANSYVPGSSLRRFSALSYLILMLVPAAKSLQSCPTLCDPLDGSPPGSPVPGILRARALEWGAISFSSA